jgi:4-amino-4-deoxy-L-arabinose transferase-like glycosyltransferase
VRGCFYCVLLPTWEGYDEPYHFAFVEYVTHHNALPIPSTPVSREVQESLHLLPLSWEQRLHVLAPPIYTHDSYWQLSDAERTRLQRQFRALPPEWQAQPGTAPTMYEAQQGPLYYWLMSLPMRLVTRWTLSARVMLVRLLSVMLSSLLVPIAYATALRVVKRPGYALGIVAVIVCMPELMIDVCRAGNESLAVAVFSLLTYVLVVAVQEQSAPWFLSAGAILGVGLLTKAYFIVAIPAFCVIAVYAVRRAPSACRHLLQKAGIGLIIAVVMSFGWYWRNHALTGSWSGEENDVEAARGGITHLFGAATHVHWVGGITSVLVSHLWFGGWSFLKLPKPLYILFVAGSAVAAFGVLRLIASDRLRAPELWVLATIYGFFWLGLLYDVLVVSIATGVSATDGWYMYAVVLPEVLLVALGLFAVVPNGWQRWVLPAIATAFAVVDLYGVVFLMAPYYTGLIAHVPGSDVVLPVRLVRLTAKGAGFFLMRLQENRPIAISAPCIGMAFVLYVVASISTVAVACKESESRVPI